MCWWVWCWVCWLMPQQTIESGGRDGRRVALGWYQQQWVSLPEAFSSIDLGTADGTFPVISECLLTETAVLWMEITFFSTFSPLLGLDEVSKIFLGLDECDLKWSQFNTIFILPFTWMWFYLDSVEFPRRVFNGSEVCTLPFNESVSEINFSKLEWSDT